jgi:hypothetical protein
MDGYLLGSYRIATAPEPNSSRLTQQPSNVTLIEYRSGRIP